MKEILRVVDDFAELFEFMFFTVLLEGAVQLIVFITLPVWYLPYKFLNREQK
jgi:hypothetical protein